MHKTRQSSPDQRKSVKINQHKCCELAEIMQPIAAIFEHKKRNYGKNTRHSRSKLKFTGYART